LLRPARRRRSIPVLLVQPSSLLRLSIPALLRRLSAAASLQSKSKQAMPVSFIKLYPTILYNSVSPVPSRTRASAPSASSSSLDNVLNGTPINRELAQSHR
jgi:hypothetical protein